MSKSALEVVFVEFARLLQPLKVKLADMESFVQFMAELGWEWPEASAVSFNGIIAEVDEMEAALEAIDFERPFDEQINEYLELVNSIRNLVPSINDIITGFPSNLPATIPAGSDFAGKIGKQLFDYLICVYLKRYHPILYNSLIFVGAIETEYVLFTDNLPSYTKYVVKWNNLSGAIGDFIKRMREKYGWNHETDPLNGHLLLNNIEEIMLACGIPTGQYNLHPAMAAKLYYQNPSDADPSVWVSHKELRIPLYEIADPDTGYVEAGFSLLAVPDREIVDKKLKGLAIAPYVEGGVGLDFELTETMSLEVTGDVKTGIAINVLPSRVFIEPDIYGTGLGFDGSFEIKFSHGSGSKKIVLFGEPGKSRFEYQELSVGLKLTGLGADSDLIAEVDLAGASLVIQASDGDGFIQKILPQDPFTLNLDFTMGISRSNGFYFKLGGGFEFTIHVNKSFGPLFINTIDLEIDANEEALTLITAVSGGASIGPVSAVVQKIGLKTLLELDKPGLLGSADISLGFKPPSGVGLSVNAVAVKGGGFLFIEEGKYAGILYLDVQDRIAITVIGILTTRLPDGSKIFSLKLLGMAEFPPIQLGYGFVLTGIGLAVAIECSMNEEALRDAVYSGSLRSLLFPSDPIANAQQIIADLESFFPPRRDYHVFGAMVRLGWGGATPLIKADVGIFVEIGGPLRIALAGIAHAELPTEENAKVVLQLQVLGILDFGKESLSIDSSLGGSRLMDWPIDGDIALRSNWGDNPRFATSTGGFYPGYAVPAGFPPLDRISVIIGSENPWIGLFLYMALTENSVHFGAALIFRWEQSLGKIDLGWFGEIDLGRIELDGEFTFNALFQFNPFYFETNMSASLSLKWNGSSLMSVSVRLALTGPNNYHAVGYAKAKICGVGVEVGFDKEFGRKRPELPQSVLSPLEALRTELDEPKNWSTDLPSWGANRVVFREDMDTEDMADPPGFISFRQKSIPLKAWLEKFGKAAIPAGEDYFDVVPPEDSSAQNLEDFFAPSDFTYQSVQEKVSGPVFEKFKSGLRFSSQEIEVNVDKRQDKEMVYETKVLNKPGFETGVVKPCVLQNAQILSGKKIRDRIGLKPGSAKQRGILVEEQKFAVVTPEAEGDQFKRAVEADLTYAGAMQMKKKLKTKEAELVDSARAVSV